MKPKHLFLGALLLLATAPLAAGPLTDSPCLRGQEPAATLLVPYFEVDLDAPGGRTTLVGVVNTLEEPVLAHVVIWSNWASPILAFDLYLTGYDVQTLNLRDVLAGKLPQTGETHSPRGNASDPNRPFPGCDGSDVRPGPVDVDFVRKALTGREVRGGCWSTPAPIGAPPNSLATGYITIDVVNRCSTLVPGDEGYFAAGGTGVASNLNALTGDWFLVEPGEDFAKGDAAVHLAADAEFFQPGDVTFYRRYVGGDASDARRPLSWSWATRFVTGGGFDGGTDLIVWKEVEDLPAPPASCDTQSTAWMEFGDQTVVTDEEENRVLLDAEIESDQFPLVTQTRGASDLYPGFSAGWYQIAFAFGRPYQAWVGAVLSADDRYSLGVAGTPLRDFCAEEEP